jgi:hypothetical protein
MKRSIALALIAATVALAAWSSSAAATSTAATPPIATTQASVVVAVPTIAVVTPAVVGLAPAPSAAPAHTAPATPAAATRTITGNTPAPSATATPGTTVATRTAYINAMYLSVVPAGERAALAGRYVLGYNLPGLACGTGCSGLFGGQARSSFDNTFFNVSLAYQRNTLAHEAAHAYGFLFFSDYATPSWAGVGGWQTQFNSLDRSFAKTYDAEAWAACVAWKETGFNNRVDQIASVCTPQAAVAAMAQIP